MEQATSQTCCRDYTTFHRFYKKLAIATAGSGVVVTAGWPPEDIYIIENTGVMDSNQKGKLSLQNPFFVNYTRLEMYGVNIIRTPTLLTFAQLQNFFLSTAVEKKWPHYFWGHMDVVALSWEDRFKKAHPDLLGASADHSAYESLYLLAIKELRAIKKLSPPDSRWALRFFAYDRLALVNTNAYVEIGGYDSQISYYMSDCDMHARLSMAGFKIKTVEIGIFVDIASSLDDLIVLYKKKGTGVRPSFLDPNILMDQIIEEEEKAAEAKKEEHGDKEQAAKRAKRLKNDADAKVELNQSNQTHDADSLELKTYWKDIKEWESEDMDSEASQQLVNITLTMQESKARQKKGRNTWQSRQSGGLGDPYYRDPAGFEKALEMTIEGGKAIFAEKWGHRDCDIVEKGLVTSDAWKVEHDW